MSHTIDYEQECNTIVARTGGELEASAFPALVGDVLAALQAHSNSHVLVDHSASTGAGLSAANIERIASLTRSLAGPLRGKKLAVVSPGDLEFGLSRMWQELMADEKALEIGVFREVAQARAWLSC